MKEVFETCDRQWRGIGMIPQSGWRLNADYADYDAEKRFEVLGITTVESPLCRSGEVLQDDQTQRVLGVRQGMHSPFTLGRPDGLQRGGARRTTSSVGLRSARDRAPGPGELDLPVALRDQTSIVMGHGGEGGCRPN